MALTGAVPDEQARAQLLDNLAVERERGITIKAQTVSLLHVDPASGELYLLNLIDTPGHVDFSYEVSRSIAACQGALLLVDATKGVQAQTVANFFLAFEQDLAIVPTVNKVCAKHASLARQPRCAAAPPLSPSSARAQVDLPHADVQGALAQMADAFDVPTDDALRISAKTVRRDRPPSRHALLSISRAAEHLARRRMRVIRRARDARRCCRRFSSACRRPSRARARRCACCSSTRGMTTFWACSVSSRCSMAPCTLATRCARRRADRRSASSSFT